MKMICIVISVRNGIVVLTGHIKTYNERCLVGQEVCRTRGGFKVLTQLHVSEPETAAGKDFK
jgi:osmotically-inducible protein OsmY